MKALTALIALFAAATAHAAPTVVQTLELDLDGDGRPDLIQTLDTGAPDNLTLEITLAASGRKLSYGKLLRKWKGDVCGTFSKDGISAGPGNTLVWNEGINTEDDMFGECRYMEKRDLAFRLAGDDLALVRADITWQSWSMGGPAPHVTEAFDFAGGTLDLKISEHHEFDFNRHRSEKLRAGCSSTARAIEQSGFPMCAAQQEHFLYLELFPEDGENNGAPVCPELNGAYVCAWKSGNDTYNEQTLVIHRLDGKVHRYDVSSDNVLIADGKTRVTSRDSTGRKLQTTTCRRELLQATLEDWLTLDKGDKRKPVYDRFPFRKTVTSWTQLDLDGKRFSFREDEQYLNDDGTYRKVEPRVMDCVKQEAP